MTGVCLAILRRDIRLVLGRGSEGLAAVLFFAVVASLFPFVFGADAAALRQAAAGVVWVAALLAALLALEAVYHRDFDDGTFDLLLLAPAPPVSVMAAKMLSHWVVSGLPLLAASVIVSQMLLLPARMLPVLLASLTLGTIYMSLIGGLGAALTLGSRRPGLLLALLVLPLFVPMLILGVLCAEAALAQLPVRAYLLLQLALVVAALPLAPFLAAAALRAHVRSS